TQETGAQSVTVEDSMSMVHLSRGVNPPASAHLLSEPMIVARFAQAALSRSKTPWTWMVADYSRIRDKIGAVFDDFFDFNQRASLPGGFRLPNAAAQRIWNTTSRKAEFSVHEVPCGTSLHRA